MEMTLRWYGSKFDTVTLEQIRQIPGVTGVITTLYDTAPGEVWSRERIAALKAEVAAAGLHISGIESLRIVAPQPFFWQADDVVTKDFFICL